MKMRRRFFLTMLLSLMMILSSACSSETGSKDAGGKKSGKKEITVWSFTNEGEYAVKKYMEKNPDVKVNFQHIPGDQYQTKLRSALQTGVNAPDVFATEYGFVRKFIDFPSLENLSDVSYNADDLIGQQYEYVQAIETDSEGQIKALGYQGTPGGFYYRRDLAKQYLGTDDPAEVSELISSWDKIFEIGKRVYDESGGKVHALSNWNAIGSVQSGNVTSAWVEDGKLVIDPDRMKVLDLAIQAKEMNVLAMLENWSAGMWAAMQSGDVMFFPGPTWYLNFVIKENAPETSGNWGIAHGPGSFSGGGTFYSIYSKSENKELAWDFIKFYSFDHEFLEQLAKEQSYFTSNREVNAKLAPELTDEFLAGQKYFEFFNIEGEKVHPVLRSEFDGDIDTIFSNNMESFVKGNIKTKEEFLEKFKAEVKHDFPDIVVD
ncbi:ABC-type glycerol-3-phosphate transport system substrate-binding protein [Lederbergia wuyishanensis]|uniref:ABC-type glycerol-3-phosphate transport system substrate-binding protein n=2 Tax=Lederbergia wuyishanensis TaxID=1347903 RepID=A0ABU0D7Y6_9BACI|nr:ABC-type glycerol-3-phosphate transport system substrate-binding protein [Lederbergia wuyishanensis]